MWILILFLLQTTLCARYKIFGVVPNLVLVFAVSAFAVNSIPRSAFLAVFAGLMLDWSAGRAGVNALLLLYHCSFHMPQKSFSINGLFT